MATTPRYFRALHPVRDLDLWTGDAVRYDPTSLYPVTILRHLGADHSRILLEAFADAKLEEIPPNTPSPDAVAPAAPAGGFGWGHGSSEPQ